jgi:hypothetical protein
LAEALDEALLICRMSCSPTSLPRTAVRLECGRGHTAATAVIDCLLPRARRNRQRDDRGVRWPYWHPPSRGVGVSTVGFVFGLGLMLRTPDTTEARFVPLRRSVSPVPWRSTGFGAIAGIPTRSPSDRERPCMSDTLTAVTVQGRARLACAFGCGARWSARRCQRRRRRRVPLGRVLGAGRRARLGDCGW